MHYLNWQISLIPLLMFSLITSLSSTYGQSIIPHQLCVDINVTVTPDSYGIILYKRLSDVRLTSCQLNLTGFNNEAYISLPGLDETASVNSCNNTPVVYSNNITYCVRGSNSTNMVIIQVIDDQLSVTLPTVNVPSFQFFFYSNGKMSSCCLKQTEKLYAGGCMD